MNVVSLVPSGTELLAAMDIEPVAISHHCEYPDDDVPVISHRAADIQSASSGSSACTSRIHQSVAEAATDDIHAIDIEALQAVEPDVILTRG